MAKTNIFVEAGDSISFKNRKYLFDTLPAGKKGVKITDANVVSAYPSIPSVSQVAGITSTDTVTISSLPDAVVKLDNGVTGVTQRDVPAGFDKPTF